MTKKPKRHLILVAAIGFVLLSGCASQRTTELTDQLLMANLWMRSSAEYKALCHQSFNLARERLDQALEANHGEQRLAVVVDCDDTVIDTSRYGAWMIATGSDYSRSSWVRWLAEDSAAEVPGASDFLRYAESRGVSVFYITNRRAESNSLTLANLASLSFPFADDEHLLARTESSDKSERRAAVAETHRIVLLIGDNLGDFDQVFQGHNPEKRAALVEGRANEFGERFIVLPNPTYGEWEEAVYGYKDLSDAEKVARRKAALDPW
jgi:5'-nucleotidase (lipoprotein e(P4) family)